MLVGPFRSVRGSAEFVTDGVQRGSAGRLVRLAAVRDPPVARGEVAERGALAGRGPDVFADDETGETRQVVFGHQLVVRAELVGLDPGERVAVDRRRRAEHPIEPAPGGGPRRRVLGGLNPLLAEAFG